MIKPVKKVHVEKSLISGTYYVETRDESVFKLLEEFGHVSLGLDLGNDTRWFEPSKLYDPDDIKDMLDSLNKPPTNFFEKVTKMVKGLKACDGETIDTMYIGQRAYTVPWAFDGDRVLTWNHTVDPKKRGTCNMPITRISLDTWEIEPVKSDYWNCIRVRRP